MNRTDQLKSIAKDFGFERLAKSLIEDDDSHGITENELHNMVMTEARKQFPNESPAKAFAKYFENNTEVRKALQIAKNQQMGSSFVKGYASLKPTSTEVGNTNVEDDSAEAIRLLNEMAKKQGRKFEQVFADPSNRELAARTYRRSSTSGDELQRR